MHSEAGQGGWYSCPHLSQIKLNLPGNLLGCFFCNFTSRLDFGSHICPLQGPLFLPLLTLKADKLKTYKEITQSSFLYVLHGTLSCLWPLWSTIIYQTPTQALTALGIQTLRCPPPSACQSTEKKRVEVERKRGGNNQGSRAAGGQDSRLHPRKATTTTAHCANGSGTVKQPLAEGQLALASSCLIKKQTVSQRSDTGSLLWDVSVPRLAPSQNNKCLKQE